MALIMYEDYDEIAHVKNKIFFSTREGVQHEYCKVLENELSIGTPLLFENPDVKEYLANYNISYKGNYILHSDDWGALSSDRCDQFVTFIYYSLQLSCLALYFKKCNIVIENANLVELKYLLPVLKKKDIYLNLKVNSYTKVYFCIEVVRKGVELRIAGKSSNEMSIKELERFLLHLFDDSTEPTELTRELDAKVFNKEYLDLFEPSSMLLADYAELLGGENIRDYQYLIDQEDYQYLTDQEDYQYLIETSERFKETRVDINGRNNFTGCYRRYPIHFLFHIDGEWKYIHNNSCKNPSCISLLSEAVLEPEPFDFNKQCHVDVSGADKVFVLVLDCDETCDVSKYWEHVCFLAKYDKESNVLEICDKDWGLLEFHELLQQSTDL